MNIKPILSKFKLNLIILPFIAAAFLSPYAKAYTVSEKLIMGLETILYIYPSTIESAQTKINQNPSYQGSLFTSPDQSVAGKLKEIEIQDVDKKGPHYNLIVRTEFDSFNRLKTALRSESNGPARLVILNDNQTLNSLIFCSATGSCVVVSKKSCNFLNSEYQKMTNNESPQGLEKTIKNINDYMKLNPEYLVFSKKLVHFLNQKISVIRKDKKINYKLLFEENNLKRMTLRKFNPEKETLVSLVHKCDLF